MKKTLLTLCTLSILILLLSLSTTDAFAQNDSELIFILVEPDTQSIASTGTSIEDTSASFETISEPFILQFRDTNIIGIIPTVNAKFTVYSNSNAVISIEAYSILPDSSTGAYKLASTIPMVTSTTGGQNLYNKDLLANYPPIGVDTINYSATRPVSILGKDEIAIVGKTGGFGSESIKGVVSFDFDTVNFQLAHIQGSAIEMSIPSITEPTSFKLIANKQFGMSEIIPLDDGSEVPGQGGNSYDRKVLIQLLGTESLELFGRMQELNVRIFPFQGITDTYTPERFMRITMDEQPFQRSFKLGDVVVPLEGAIPQLRLLNGQQYGNGILDVGEEAIVQSVNNQNGELIVKQTGAQAEEIVDAWLVEVKQ